PALSKLCDLVDQTLPPHPLDTRIEPRDERAALDVDADDAGVRVPQLRLLRKEGTVGLRPLLQDLQGADDAAGVLRVDAGGGLRVGRAELLVQGASSPVGEVPLEPGAHLGVAR